MILVENKKLNLIYKKKCSCCKEIKDIALFNKNKNTWDGLAVYCKSCKRLKDKKSHEKYKDKRNMLCNEHYAKNRKKYNILGKEWRINNKEKINQRRIRMRKHDSSVSLKNHHKKYKENIQYRISCTLRGRFRQAVDNCYKSGSAIKLLGVPIDIFKIHIEQQFTKGMTWENYGLHGWHIDHIRPCASFDLTDPEQQKQCFHYTNLQPLWAEDNLKKSDRLDWSKNEQDETA
jgi:hypothetical protein